MNKTEIWHGCKGRLIVELPDGTVTLNVVVNLTKDTTQDELIKFTFNGVADGPPVSERK